MMEWATPWAFALLLPVFGLLFQRRLTGVNRLAVAKVDALVPRTSLRRVAAWLPDLLRLVGLVLLVVALARPRVAQRRISVESDGLDIMLAIDTSGSMEQQDLAAGVNRLQVAKGVMQDFVEGRPYDRIGVVVFGEEAFTYVPLTTDHQTLQGSLAQTRIGVAGQGSTAIGQAIAVAARRLKDLKAPSKVIVLLTDGRNNAGRVSPMEASQAAAALGIRVYTIGVGGAGRRSFFSPFADGVDDKTLGAIARTTGGRYWRATDRDALSDVFEEIGALEPSPAEVRELLDYQEYYRWFAVPGVLMLLLQVLLSATLLRRAP